MGTALPAGLQRLVATALSNKPLRYLIALAFIGSVVRRALALRHTALGVDSWAPMLSALDYIRDHGADLVFENVFFEGGVKFQYPPSSLLFLEPFYRAGLRSPGMFNAINHALMVANSAVMALLVLRLWRDRLSAEQRPTVAWGVALVALYYEPARLAYSIGQIQVLLNLLFSLSCLLLISERERLSGVMLGIATVIKPQFGPLLLIQLLRKRFGFAIGFIATGAIIGVVSLVVYGLPSHVTYLKVLSFLSERGESFYWNESINGIAHRLTGNGASNEIVEVMGVRQSIIPPYHAGIAFLTRASTLVLLCAPFVFIGLRRRSADGLLAYCLATVFFVISSPIAWTHHYGVLLPAFAVVALSMVNEGRGARLRLGLLVVSFLLTAVRWPEFADAKGLATLLQVPTFAGACILAALLVRQLFSSAEHVAQPTPNVAEEPSAA